MNTNVRNEFIQLTKSLSRGADVIKIFLDKESNDLVISNDLDNIYNKMEEKRFKYISVNDDDNNIQAPIFYISTINNHIIKSECINYYDSNLTDTLLFKENKNDLMLVKRN